MAADYYKTLGVNKNASADELKSAYRNLAKKYHPDLYGTASDKEKADAEQKFKDVQHAYEVLSDPQKKAAYDQYGNENGPQGFSSDGFSANFSGGFGDIFSDIFSAFSGGGTRRTADRTGDDIEVGMQLTFEEAAFGVEKEVTYSRVEKCAPCKGTGAKDGTAYKTCTKCGGSGRVVFNQRTMLGMMQNERICDMCNGTGKIIVEQCKECRGRSRVRAQRTVKVKIPAGVDNNQMLTMQNEGSSGTNNGANGNLIIVFRVQPHILFIRDGVNLKMDLPITVTEAILGANLEIPTLTKSVKVTIPEGTQDGTIIRVKGKGIKHLRKDVYGDLFVKIIIDIPKDLSSKQKRQLQGLQDVLKDGKYEKREKYEKTLKRL
ncbi:MAG: molecular chaperone DnaJ [Clostridia bacterium]